MQMGRMKDETITILPVTSPNVHQFQKILSPGD